MALSDYTTPQEIRAVLGVSRTELTDETLALSIYATMATLALEDISVNLPTNFSSVSALPSPTTQQRRFLDLVKLFVPYQIAKELLVSLPLFAVSQLSDGRAEFQRNALQLEDIKDGVDATLLSLRYRLVATYSSLYPSESVASATITQPSITVSTGLAVNPVTGT